MWLFSLEIGGTQLPAVAEIAPKSPFICVNRSPIRYGFRDDMKSYLIWCEHPSRDMWLSTLEMGAAQHLAFAEIAPKSPFICVNRSPIRYGFCACAKAILYSVNRSAPDWNLPIAPGIYLHLPMVPAGYLKHVIYESVECHRVTHGRKQDTGIN